MTSPPRKKRHFLAVELQLDCYHQAKAAAAESDTAVSAWVRQLVLAELKRNPPKQVAVPITND